MSNIDTPAFLISGTFVSTPILGELEILTEHLLGSSLTRLVLPFFFCPSSPSLSFSLLFASSREFTSRQCSRLHHFPLPSLFPQSPLPSRFSSGRIHRAHRASQTLVPPPDLHRSSLACSSVPLRWDRTRSTVDGLAGEVCF